jgi:hypothetical protein
MPIVAAVAWALGFGLVSARMAAWLDRSVPVWFVFGAVLGPIALVLLWLAPPAWCRTCLMPTRGMLRACWWCGTRFRSGSSLAAGPGVPRASPDRRLDPPDHAHPVRAMQAAPPVSVRASPMAPAQPTSAAPPSSTVQPPATGHSADPVPTMDPSVRGASRRRPIDAARPPSLTSDADATDDRGPAHAQLDPIGPITMPDASAKPTAPSAIASVNPTRPATIVGTGVYFSGTVNLELGGRYGFMIDGSRFRILGPLSPSIVALDRALIGMTVSMAHGRLVLAIPDGRFGELLVFASIVGASLDKVAEAIGQAVLDSGGR